MCGVAGIFAYHYASLDVDVEELRKIRDHMAARGPDGSGEWLSNDRRVGLGHRRLSIIDLDERASQPMVSADGKHVISFNGEIYNYRGLRGELEKKGRCFRTESDTEVLLQMYAEYGTEMLPKLRGMFAFALWDGEKKKMLLARDPYGIKPLYYADDGWTLRTASQVKALLTSSRISKDPEPAGAVGFFLLGSVPEPVTLYQEIRSLPAGSYVWVNSQGAGQSVCYFSLAKIWSEAEQKKTDPIEEHVPGQIRAALLDSIKHHFVADVPVGLFLSAGIDSGILLALACQAGVRHLKAVTLGFEEFSKGSFDERPLAAEMARRYDVEHHTYLLTRQEFERDLPKVFESMDQPTLDGVNTYFVSKAAKSIGLKVALSGIGGDELLGGYESFREVPRWVRALYIPSRVPLLGQLFQACFEAFLKPLKIFHPKVSGMLKFGGSFPGAYYLKRGLFMPWELGHFLESEMVAKGLRRLSMLTAMRDSLRPSLCRDFSKISILESAWYLKNQLLRDADWAGMAHSLEIRTPFVDTCLLRTLAPVLVKRGATVGKSALVRKAIPELPAEVSKRKKTGFTLPMSAWIRPIAGESGPRPHSECDSAGLWARTWAPSLYQRMAA